jgi:peptide chain release factor 3
LFFTKTSTGGAQQAIIDRISLGSPEMNEKLSRQAIESLEQELSLIESAGNEFEMRDFLSGKTTPVFFASALTNFGIEPFFDAFIDLAPSPHSRIANNLDGSEVEIDPVTTPFSAYIFKIQSNMNKKHRDSMAFMRICSGKFEKDMVVKHHRMNKEIRLSRPHSMFSGERTTLEAAYAGDIMGVINPGVFFIGDTISMTGGFNFKPLPQFQPEIFAKVIVKDVGKRKSFDKGVRQLAQEGAIQLLYPYEFGSEVMFAAVGQLQFEVLQYRLLDEYGVETLMNTLPYQCSAWIVGDMSKFQKSSNCLLVKDMHDKPMVLFGSSWEKDYAMKKNPDHQFLDLDAKQ